MAPPIAIVYLVLGIQALVPITLGSFKSLHSPSSSKKVKSQPYSSTKSLSEQIEDDEENDEEDIGEVLTLADSIWFPILGSIALVSLWLLIKYVGTEWLNLVLSVYFTGAGMFAFQSTFGTILRYCFRLIQISSPMYHVRISSGLKQIFHLPISLPSLLLLPISIAFPILYIYLDKPYILSNILALCLATAALSLLKLDSFPTSFLLLGLLLIYDIFWVFATPVMVTVARGIDAPIKLLSPRSPTDFAMLGLGDVVVPGLAVALCLRFDFSRHAASIATAQTGSGPSNVKVSIHDSFSKPYFYTALASYVLGLGTTMGVMHYTHHAQPALLYLSPACVLGPALLALIRGELKLMWKWSDSPDATNIVTIDHTIEPASEAAIRAREEQKAAAATAMAPEEGVDGEEGAGALAQAEAKAVNGGKEDESWMTSNTGVVTPASEQKAKKRKGKK